MVAWELTKIVNPPLLLSGSDIEYDNAVVIFMERKVLSAVVQVFDPLGLFLPVTIKTRIFIQDLW